MTWPPLPALTALARTRRAVPRRRGRSRRLRGGGQAGNRGRGSSPRFWWSADLANWTSGGSSGTTGSVAAAAVAVGDGFVAVGLAGGLPHDLDVAGRPAVDRARPGQADRRDHRDTAVRRGRRRRPLRGGGLRHRRRGRHPHRGDHGRGRRPLTQVVLGAGGAPATVTGVTATSSGFVAVGLVGPAKAQRRRRVDLAGRPHLVRRHPARPRDGTSGSPRSPAAAARSPAPRSAARTRRC